MGIETERRFLVNPDKFSEMRSFINKNSCVVTHRIRQGYLSNTENGVVRVRHSATINTDRGVIDPELFGFITIKGPKTNGSCQEFEYTIPELDARKMMNTLKMSSIISKKRSAVSIRAGNLAVTLEIDEFKEANDGLVIVEIELDNFNDLDVSALPSFIGPEITGDETYSNAYLSEHPFSTRETK